MKRSSFLKTLVGLAVAPKVLAEITPPEPKLIDPDYQLKYAKQAYKDSQEPLRVGDIIMDSNGNTGRVQAICMGKPTIRNIHSQGPEINIENGYTKYARAYTQQKETNHDFLPG